jgi:hypothetical protein
VARYLEVLASFRPDPTLQAEMDDIEGGDDDDEFPTIPPGRLDRRWCEQRLVCTAGLSGCFAVPSHRETLPTLREQFLPLATTLGLTDVDAAAVREGDRELSQSMSGWIYEIVGPDGERMNGIQCLSRHGGDSVLWAIYERGSAESPPEVTARDKPGLILSDDEALAEGDAHTPDHLAIGRQLRAEFPAGADAERLVAPGPRSRRRIRASDTLVGALGLDNGR